MSGTASYSQLMQVVSRIRMFTGSVNGDSERAGERESLRLVGNPSSLQLNTGFALQDFAGAPESCFDIWYSYRSSGKLVSAIDIRLGDFSRELTVSGTSKESVDALTAIVAAELNQLESGFGGFGQRMLGAFLYVILSLVALIWGVDGLPRRTSWLPLGFSIAAIIGLVTMPWERWFPGTLAFPNDGGFLVRYGPELSFISLALSVLLFLAGPAYAEYVGKRRGAQSQPNIRRKRSPRKRSD